MVNDEFSGCVTTLSEVFDVIRAENKIRRSFSKSHFARYIITDFLHEGANMKEVVSKLAQFSSRSQSGSEQALYPGSGNSIETAKKIA